MSSKVSRVTGTDAVIYLRVSTPGQLKTSYDGEGQSIPSQRSVCKQRVREVRSVVVKEFIDLGKTATSMDKRLEFKQLMAYVAEHPSVKYVVVYSLSRMAPGGLRHGPRAR